MYQKCCEEKHADLLLTAKESKRHYALIKDFNTFMYGQTSHRGRKHFFLVIVYKLLKQQKV